MESSNLLELSGQRKIGIRDRGRLYIVTLAQVQASNWLQYFDGIVSRSKPRGKETVNTFDANTAMLRLLDDLLVDAAGYALPDGVDSIQALDNWKGQLPLSHKLAAGRVLTTVEVVEDDEAPIMLGVESVRLKAIWNCDDQGRMQQFTCLVHNFRTPDFDHQRRYMRDQSRSTVVGGSRTGETIWTGVQRTLVELYDDLIDSVEGYSLKGEPLQASDLKRNMDTYHKVVAMQQVFSAAGPETEAA